MQTVNITFGMFDFSGAFIKICCHQLNELKRHSSCLNCGFIVLWICVSIIFISIIQLTVCYEYCSSQ